ncbi:MAG: glycosyltransferase [Candidatus Omnitrophota bacterium]|jgi:glycosyltransferase involved in cell wall biosynthesis|nr:MAG: glycosyltransferase [Candidatus Omnitrophota bacterium]
MKKLLKTPCAERRKNSTIKIFILIDALGWAYIKDRPFLNSVAVTKMPIKSILGFSSGVIPSILTGKYPQEHNHWSLYYYSPKTSPFRWTKMFSLILSVISKSRGLRWFIEKISKTIMQYTGYFESYLIPLKQLYFFDICEKRNIYTPKGIEGTQTIFDVLEQEKIDYKCYFYPLKDQAIFLKAEEDIKTSTSSFYFLYLSESDAALHKECKDASTVNEMIDFYEKQIYDLFKAAQERNSKVDLFVFSDHGMAPVEKSFDLKNGIEELGLKIPNDYVPFYDSTMARFWFFTHSAKKAIDTHLIKHTYGRILSEKEKKEYGINFENDRYGETIFLMHTGSVINPSYMNNKIPQGMHGYDVNESQMDAVLVSNVEIKENINDVKEFFNLMIKESNNVRINEPGHHTARKVKILYFLNSTTRGGAEEHVLNLLKHIDKTRFEAILACPQELLNLLEEDIKPLGIKTYPATIRRWRNITGIISFLKVLNRERPDIVNSHLFFATRFAAPLAKIAGVPKVIETAHIREAWRQGVKKMYWIDRIFYSNVDKIIAVSFAVKKYLSEEKGIKPDKIEVIHNGVDLKRFTPGKIENEKEGMRIGVIGRLELQKGHKYFLRAISELNGTIENIKCFVAGEGIEKENLMKLAASLHIERNIQFLGYCKDIPKFIQTMDIIVLPSLYEGLPLVALEAGAMGKPVIATNVDGSPEAIIDKTTGLIVPAQDHVALKDAIAALLKNKQQAYEYGSNAQAHIREKFSLKKQLESTQNLYMDLLNRQS